MGRRRLSFALRHPALRTKYKFDSRGTDGFDRMSWDEANRYLAKGLIAIARTYSGAEGRRRLIEKDGYAGDAGALGGSRHARHEAGQLVAAARHHRQVRHLPHGEPARPARRPRARRRARSGQGRARLVGIHLARRPGAGQPFVHGLQTSEIDFNDLRSPIHVQVGKNLVENKMPEAHWLIEIIENAAAGSPSSHPSTIPRPPRPTIGFRCGRAFGHRDLPRRHPELMEQRGTTRTSSRSSPISRCSCAPTP